MAQHDVRRLAEAERDWQEELYRDLHAHPELSMEEHRTHDVIADRLGELGYDVRRIGGGVVGVLENGAGPTVLFRADTDALPVREDTGLPYTSQTDGVMHACGHDMHIACGLGAAAALAGHRDLWSGTYLALFQPAEETAQGAAAMVADGLTVKLPKIDVALGQHVMGGTAGRVAAAAGARFAQGDSIKVTVFGHGSHGSMPHMGVDPVLLASSIVVRLQGVVSREIAPADFGVVTVGSIQSGTKSNVIPDSAQLLLNVRSYDPGVRDTLLQAIERIVRAECEASGSPKPPTFDYYDQFPLTDNDEAVTDRVLGALRGALGEDKVDEMAPLTGSEDFSTIPRAFGAPYSYWIFGGFEEGRPVPNHNPKFAPLLQPTLTTGTTAALAASLAWLGRDER